MEMSKKERMLQVFFRAFKGEDISVKSLADEFQISTKSITRDINEIKNFLSDNRDLVGQTELAYSYTDKVYRLYLDEFLTSKELMALLEVIIGSRAFSKIELLTIVNKLKKFTTPEDRNNFSEMIKNEMFHYSEVKHDCDSVLDTLWKISEVIREKKVITIRYYKMNREYVERKICPLSIMFTEYYFYLIAYKFDDASKTPVYFRIDRITDITEHRAKFDVNHAEKFDEGELRRRCQFMFPGKLQTIRFEFSGPSVQAILDRLPTAKIIDKTSNGKYIIEAEVYGTGIKMFLLSQGFWVKVISPISFVDEIKSEIELMNNQYK